MSEIARLERLADLEQIKKRSGEGADDVRWLLNDIAHLETALRDMRELEFHPSDEEKAQVILDRALEGR